MRYKVIISYDGTSYYGSQIQPGFMTVQGEVEKALKNMLAHYVKTYFASRTDKGVHANYQVFHFDLDYEVKEINLKKGLNKRLPISIRVCDVKKEEETFHARHSAKLKRYKYIIYKREMLAKDLRFGIYLNDINLKLLVKALKFFRGRNDFMGFSKEKDSQKTIKNLDIKIKRRNKKIIIYFISHSFLKQMIRIIMGTCILYAKGKITEDEIKKTFITRKRDVATYTAPPQALFLDYIKY